MNPTSGRRPARERQSSDPPAGLSPAPESAAVRFWRDRHGTRSVHAPPRVPDPEQARARRAAQSLSWIPTSRSRRRSPRSGRIPQGVAAVVPTPPTTTTLSAGANSTYTVVVQGSISSVKTGDPLLFLSTSTTPSTFALAIVTQVTHATDPQAGPYTSYTLQDPYGLLGNVTITNPPSFQVLREKLRAALAVSRQRESRLGCYHHPVRPHRATERNRPRPPAGRPDSDRVFSTHIAFLIDQQFRISLLRSTHQLDRGRLVCPPGQ